MGVIRSDLSGLNEDLKLPGTASAALSSKLSALGDQMINLGRTMTLGLTLPIVGLGTALFDAGIEFEDAFAGVSKTVDGVADNFGNLTTFGENLRQQFRGLALEIPVSAVELAKLGEEAGALGIQGDQLTEFVKIVAELGVATNISAEDAGNAIARLGNIMGITSSEMGDFALSAGSAIVDLGNKSAATESEIVSMSYRIAGAGKAIGLTTQEILALSTSVSELGIQSEAGGTAVSRILLEIQSAASGTATSAQATQALASATAEVDRQLSSLRSTIAGGTTDVNTLRLMFMDTDLELGNMSLLLGGVEDGTISLDKAMSEIRTATVEKLNADFDVGASKLELFAQAAGVTVEQFKSMVKNSPIDAFYKVSSGLAAMQENGTLTSETLADLGLNSIRLRSVINNLGPGMGKLTENINYANVAWKEQTALSIEAQKRFATVKSQIILVKSAFNELGITLFDLYKGAILNFLSGIKSVLLGINDLSKSNLRWIVQIGGIAAAIGPLLIALGSLSKITSIVVAAMGRGWAVLAAINPILLVAAAAVAAFGYAYSKNLGGIQDKTKAVIKEVKNIGYWLGKAFEFGSGGFGGNLFKGVAASFRALTYIYEDNKTTFFSNVLQAFGLGEEKAQELGMVIRNFLTPPLLFLNNVFNFLGTLLPAISKWVQILVTDFLRFTGILDILRNAFVAFLSGDFDFAFESLKLAWEHVVTWYNFEGKALITQALAEIVGIILNFVQGSVMPIVNAVNGWGIAFIQWVIDVAPDVITELGKLGTSIIKWIGDIVADFIPKLYDWATAFIEWVTPVISDIIPKLGEYAETVLKWIGDATITLVEKLLEWAGAFIEWLGPVIRDILPKLGEFLGTITSWLIFDATPKLVVELLKLAAEFIAWIPKAIRDIGPKLGEFLQTLLDFILYQLIPGVANAMISFGKSFIDGMKSGIEENWDAFTNWFEDKFTGLLGGIGDLLGVGSPSKVFEDFGKAMVEGMMVGISGLQTDLNTLTDQVFGNTIDVAARAILTDSLSNIPTSISNTRSSVTNNTNVFAPNVSGVPMTGQASMLSDLDRMYRLATMAGG